MSDTPRTDATPRTPDQQVMNDAYDHALWLRRCTSPLGKRDRMLSDLGHYVSQLLAAIEKGQNNCDDVYNDLREQRDASERETISLRAELAAWKSRYESLDVIRSNNCIWLQEARAELARVKEERASKTEAAQIANMRMTISEMLEDEMIERIGVDETRDINTCLVRICGQLRHTEDELSACKKTRGEWADANHRQIGVIRALRARVLQAEELAGALGLAGFQLTKCRRFLPSHGSFGEDGINAYEHAEKQANEALFRWTASAPNVAPKYESEANTDQITVQDLKEMFGEPPTTNPQEISNKLVGGPNVAGAGEGEKSL